jgi:hypothetical protein
MNIAPNTTTQRIQVLISQSASQDREWLAWLVRRDSVPRLSFMIDARVKLSHFSLQLRAAALAHQLDHQLNGLANVSPLQKLLFALLFAVASSRLMHQLLTVQSNSLLQLLVPTVLSLILRHILLAICHMLFAAWSVGCAFVQGSDVNDRNTLIETRFCTSALPNIVEPDEYDETIEIVPDHLNVGLLFGATNGENYGGDDRNPQGGEQEERQRFANGWWSMKWWLTKQRWLLICFIAFVQYALYFTIGNTLVATTLCTPLQAACACAIVYETAPSVWRGSCTRVQFLHTLVRLLICGACGRLGGLDSPMLLAWFAEFASMPVYEAVFRLRSATIVVSS